MSGMMYDVGSVVSFTAQEIGRGVMVQSRQGDDIAVDATPLIGWAVVVTSRDMWVTHTRLEPMVECCGSVVPFKTHLEEKHSGAGVGPWSYWVMKA